MATSFPSITPTARRFTPPQWPTTEQKSQSGVVSRRLWGSRSGNAFLQLIFNNLSDTDTSSILTAYENAKGPIDELTLPTSIFAGADATLTTYLNTTATGTGLIWSFSDGSPPTVESVVGGRSNVVVTLVAELRMA
jgi:hypothetical protein